MPVAVTYPGVYIEEIPSGLRTITGVATSITAFLGRTAFGPTERPETIFSFGDFQERYGGLHYDYPLTYAVQDFFMNGGTQAVIGRLFQPTSDTDSGVAKLTLAPPVPPANWKVSAATKATSLHLPVTPGSGTAATGAEFSLGGQAYTVQMYNATTQTILLSKPLSADVSANDALTFTAPPGTTVQPAGQGTGLQLTAASPGAWANTLTVTADRRGLSGSLGQMAAAAYASFGQSLSDLFNLTVTLQQPDGTLVTERFTNLTVAGGATSKAPNRVDRVLAHQSKLVRVALDGNNQPILPSAAPADGDIGQVLTAGQGDDGQPLAITTYLGDQNKKQGMYLLDHVDLFNLLCIPPDIRTPQTDIDAFVYQAAAVYCTQRRAMLIVDPPAQWALDATQGALDSIDPSSLGITGEVNGTETARNAAVYYPRVIKEDPLMNGQTDVFAACGIIAGVMAATDTARGVWKAPAGVDAGIAGIHSLQVKLTDEQNGLLNPLGINCLRTFPVIGPVVWGARTLRGADILSDDYKYVPVRRLTLYIEESLYRGTKWAVFEPNDETLWSSLRLAVNSFLADLSRQGAFYAYNVVCDATTTTQRDIDLGVVNVLVQIAPVKPAEFVVIQIQQIAGQTPQS
jgi:uncharacterized protein